MNKNISDLIKLGEGYHAEFKESLDKSTVGFGYTAFFTTTFNRIIPDKTTNKMSGKNVADVSGKTTDKTTGKKLQERNYRKETTGKLLNLIKNHPSIKIPDIAMTLGLTEDGVNYHLRSLKKKNIIRRIGGRKQG
ncbi:MAG: winged helix-turn-helix domain-containing protein, partial [Candidatus Delongbacteria bacterium]|nr:winged helix-turn-helix domain-containing protein [Candidatus Delongbacteria bacterium]